MTRELMVTRIEECQHSSAAQEDGEAAATATCELMHLAAVCDNADGQKTWMPPKSWIFRLPCGAMSAGGYLAASAEFIFWSMVAYRLPNVLSDSESKCT